jgi:tRNA(Ile)-lysidine synthase
MKLLEQFTFEMTKHGISPDAKLLVAVSGGIDSMVMIDVVRKHYPNVSVAHVNFELRGTESDGDEQFVRNYCKEKNIPIFVKHLPIDKKKIKNGLQEAARTLRYEWFEEVRAEKGFDYIITAHHAQDRLETFFMNLTRGAGVQGLKSIPGKAKYLLRPFLRILKSEIEEYAQMEGMDWREDSSNTKLDYLRNRVRHGLIGEFSELSNTANLQASLSLDYLSEADSFFQRATERIVDGYDKKGRCIFISEADWKYLFEEPPLHKYVFDALGFTPDRLDQLKELAEKQSGKMAEGNGVVVYRSRNGFVVDTEPDKVVDSVMIEAPSKISEELKVKSEKLCPSIRNHKGVITEPISMSWHEVDGDFAKSKKPNNALLDSSKLNFPLTLRPWKPGDVFHPVGLKGKKKISDLLTDLKLSIPEKKDVLVLESDGEICWVVGFRIDERFQAEAKTEQAILFEIDGGRNSD